mmetsp:Transcript_3146/g.6304  ORF Transcript_3146/g.6304 Transcript_3146/m.6304 type:complete len:111 (+) Transcript_3146:87-419(+)
MSHDATQLVERLVFEIRAPLLREIVNEVTRRSSPGTPFSPIAPRVETIRNQSLSEGSELVEADNAFLEAAGKAEQEHRVAMIAFMGAEAFHRTERDQTELWSQLISSSGE